MDLYIMCIERTIALWVVYDALRLLRYIIRYIICDMMPLNTATYFTPFFRPFFSYVQYVCMYVDGIFLTLNLVIHVCSSCQPHVMIVVLIVIHYWLL